MQLSSITSLHSSSVEKQQRDSTVTEGIFLPMASVKNTDTQLQTSSNNQYIVLASSSKASCLLEPQAQSSVALQTQQLSRLLTNINDSIYFVYDENEVTSESPQNFNQHCHQLNIMSCTLQIKTAWYRLKNLVLNLMHSSSKGNIRKIALEQYHLEKNIIEICENSDIYHQLINENPSSITLEGKTREQYYKEIKKQSEKARKSHTDVLNRHVNTLHHYNEKEEKVIKNIAKYLLEIRAIAAFKKVYPDLSTNLIKNVIQLAAKTDFSNALNFKEETEFKIHRRAVSQEFWHLIDLTLAEEDKFKKLYDKFLLTSWKADDLYINSSKKELKKATDDKKIYALTAKQLFEEKLKSSASYIIHCILQLARETQCAMSHKSLSTKNNYHIEIKKTIDRLNNYYARVYNDVAKPYYLSKTQENVNALPPAELEKKLQDLNKDINKYINNRSVYIRADTKDIPSFLPFINHILNTLQEKGSINTANLLGYKEPTTLNVKAHASKSKRKHDISLENAASAAKKIRTKAQTSSSVPAPSWHAKTSPLRFTQKQDCEMQPLTQEEIPCLSQAKIDAINAECLGELFPELL